MASIFKRWVKRGGQRVKAKKYSIKYKDGDKWIIVAGSTSYELSQKKAALLEHEALCRQRGLVDQFSESKKETLTKHLEDFERYLSYGNTVRYTRLTMKRVVSVFIGCGFRTIDDLIRYDARGKVASYLQDRTMSNNSRNHYLTAAKNFLNWAAKDGRLPQSPILLLDKLNTATDDKRERRALTADDFAKLIRTTKRGPVTHQLTGEQRAWLYMTAAYSGLRASELGSLTPESFHLESDPPFIEVAARVAKNKQVTRQPIPADFAAMLRDWLKGQEGRLWSRLACARAAETLRVDLKAAKIPDTTADGVLDFHSLRVTYITNLARAGVHPKVAQILARHSTIDLTMKVYTKLNPNEVAQAVNSVPLAHQMRTKILNKTETSGNNLKQKASHKPNANKELRP